MSYKPLLMLAMPLILILPACKTIQPVGPSVSSACIVWEPQPFYWPDRCEATPGEGECATLQDIARVAVKNNAARESICAR